VQLEQNGQDVAAQPPTKDQLLRQAQLLRLYRQKRTETFDRGLFDEVAWDALLALYVHEKAELRVTVTRLAALVGAKAAPFVRWLHYLENLGLIIRQTHIVGGHSGSVGLTPKGRADLEHYLAETLALID